jgi:16S rRNA G966 N2-methylase RsmD
VSGRKGRGSRTFQSSQSTLPASVAALYGMPLSATRSGPIYNAFPYPTKISAESIAVFLATHTAPGQTILDCFAGVGSVGLAGLLCDRPTPSMLRMAAELGVRPKWGPRNVVLYELSVLGANAANTLCSVVDPRKFETAALQMVEEARRRLPGLYSALSPDGTIGELRYAVWSEVVKCSQCEHETPFWNAAARRKPARLIESFKCPACAKRVKVASCDRVTERAFDARLGRSVERRKRVLAAVYGRSGKTSWKRPPIAEDDQAVCRAENFPLPTTAPLYALKWGDLYRAGYHQGISHLHHLYTPRNFLAIATLWDVANQAPQELRDALKLLILSYNAAHSTLMTRIVAKTGQDDFSATSAQSGVLYVSALPVEKNVFDGVLRKIKPFRDTFALTRGSRSRVDVRNASSTRMSLESSSIDYVFTDPPFGDYIPYAEINQVGEAWLGATTDTADEVIISPAQRKQVSHYGQLMATVFSEIARVLKPEHRATVVFHSAEASVWKALAHAYSSAKLEVETTSVLDKVQPTFKQTTAESSVKGDPMILLRNGARPVAPVADVETSTLLGEFLRQAKHMSRAEQQPHRLYSRFVNRCLELGVDVSIGAKEFYGVARESMECHV